MDVHSLHSLHSANPSTWVELLSNESAFRFLFATKWVFHFNFSSLSKCHVNALQDYDFNFHYSCTNWHKSHRALSRFLQTQILQIFNKRRISSEWKKVVGNITSRIAERKTREKRMQHKLSAHAFENRECREKGKSTVDCVANTIIKNEISFVSMLQLQLQSNDQKSQFTSVCSPAIDSSAPK